MNQINTNLVRILALAPTTRGVGYAILEDTLIDWGVKITEGKEKNKKSVERVKELIAKYQPGMIVLQNTKNSKRSARIKRLCQQIINVAKTQKVKASLFSHEQVRRTFFGDTKGTKDALAEIIAKQFPELISCLPPKRNKAYMSENYKMGIFDAMALGLMPSMDLKRMVEPQLTYFPRTTRTPRLSDTGRWRPVQNRKHPVPDSQCDKCSLDL